MNISQYIKDVQDNADHALSTFPLLTDGSSIRFHLSPCEDANASAIRSASDQFLVIINKGLINDCLELFSETIPEFYRAMADRIQVSQEQFLRTVCGAATEMVFWHEIAHICRGHHSFLSSGAADDVSVITELGFFNASSEKVEPDPWRKRFVELDADIFGGQFLLARFISIMNSKRNPMPASDLLCAYAIGVRGLFEVFFRNGFLVHDDADDSTHPHPLSRAYVAFSHGLASACKMAISEEIYQQWAMVTQVALLQYEVQVLGQPVDTDVLQKFMNSELSTWHSKESQLIPYQLLTKKSVPKRNGNKYVFGSILVMLGAFALYYL